MSSDSVFLLKREALVARAIARAVPLAVIQREESLDPADEIRAAPDRLLGAGFRGKRLQLRVVGRLPRRHHLRQRFDELRAGMEDGVEPGFPQAIAQHFVLGDDGRAASLAGEQPHLAEIRRRRERSERLRTPVPPALSSTIATRPRARMNSESAGSPCRAMTSSATNGKSARSPASASRSPFVKRLKRSSPASVAMRSAASRAWRSFAGFGLVSTRCG